MRLKTQIGISKRLFIGLFSLAISMSIFIIQPNKLYRKMKLTLMENGELFELWLSPDVDPITNLYLFNITNAENFLAGKEKLRVQEVGPYIYKETSIHANPSFNHSEGTVFTHPSHKFEWVPELNTRSENDTFLLPNIPLLVKSGQKILLFVFYNVKNWLFAQKLIDLHFEDVKIAYIYQLYANRFSGTSPLVRMAANTYSMTDRDPITKQSVRDVMYGVRSQYIMLGNIFMPQWIPFDKFGLFEQISGVTPETWETYTGEKNFHQAGRIAKYNNKTTLPQWEAPCNRIIGATDGKKFGNDINLNETLYIFHRSLCRTIPMVPAGPETVSDQWLPTTPYKIPDDALDNGERNSENKCYCLKGKCLPSGLIDLKKCYYDFSVGVSYPHFYKGHHSLRENIDGLEPNSSLHEPEWHINREAGVITSCSIRFQFNLVLENVTIVEGCRPFSNLIVPIAWVEVTVPRLNPTSALRLYIGLQVFPIFEKISTVFWLLVGVLCIYYEIKAEWGGKSSTKRKYQRRERPSFSGDLQHVTSLLPYANS